MTQTKDHAIRERAYAIWENEGSPPGRHEQHWDQAARELEEAAADGGANAPKAKAPRGRPRAKSAGAPASADKATTAPAAADAGAAAAASPDAGSSAAASPGAAPAAAPRKRGRPPKAAAAAEAVAAPAPAKRGRPRKTA